MRPLRILATIAATGLFWASSLYWLIRLPGMEAASYATQDTEAWRVLRQGMTTLRQAAGAHGPETNDMLFTELYAALCLILAIAVVWTASRLLRRAVAYARRERAGRINA